MARQLAGQVSKAEDRVISEMNPRLGTRTRRRIGAPTGQPPM